MAASKRILGPESLQWLKAPKVYAFSIAFGKHHAYPKNTGGVFEADLHPRYTLRMRSYYQRTDPLWWNCIVSNKTGGQKAVRSWLNNRARVAITGALQRRGYAKDGSRLKAGKSTDTRITDLVGSAQFQCRDTLLHTSWEDLCHQADEAIKALEIALNPQETPRRDGAAKPTYRRTSTPAPRQNDGLLKTTYRF